MFLPQAGRRKGDRTIGRFLADTVDAVPLISRPDLETLFNDNVQASSLLSSAMYSICIASSNMINRWCHEGIGRAN